MNLGKKNFKGQIKILDELNNWSLKHVGKVSNKFKWAMRNLSLFDVDCSRACWKDQSNRNFTRFNGEGGEGVEVVSVLKSTLFGYFSEFSEQS